MAGGQIVIEGAGLPGAANSYYSAEKSLTCGASGYTLVPEVGFIMFEAGLDADLTLALKIAATPTYATLSASQAGALVWSDGTNLYVHNVGTQATAKYFCLNETR